MSTEHPSKPLPQPKGFSGRLFVIILIPIIILTVGWLIYARWDFRGRMPPAPTPAQLP